MGLLEGIVGGPFRPGARLRGSKRAEVRVHRLFCDLFLRQFVGNSVAQWAEAIVATNAVVCLIWEKAQNQEWAVMK
jgi:hypothetical protein